MQPTGSHIVFQTPVRSKKVASTPLSPKRVKIRIGHTTKEIIQSVSEYNGVSITESNDFNIFWGTSPETDRLSPSSQYQKFNHFPQSRSIIGDKAALAKMIQAHPLYSKFEPFFPATFVLPEDNSKLYQVMKEKPDKYFISKPPRGRCGRGIQILSYKDYYMIKPGSVVSDYIANPLLIDGFKFDMRIYVLVTSFYPLRAFIFREGIARFATETYMETGDQPLASITNTSLNKKGDKYTSEFKWTLTELLPEIEKRWGRKKEDTMADIIRIVSQTLIIAQAKMVELNSNFLDDRFFELYGFDLLIDSDFRTWLLEVNTMPFLGIDDRSDIGIKGNLFAQTLSIVGIKDLDLSDPTIKHERCHTDIEDFESYFKQIVEREDLYNHLSGGNYIRFFPSPLTEHFQPYLLEPCIPPKAQ